ncbi:MAG TPA: class I SAM-dependent methyltransferase [Polyangiaceae bacterium]|nr:class I SAM-dependent methyltransferase [Polyangiaceae bacterium]
MDRLDNTTAHAAADYESEVGRTIPFHALMLEQVVDVVLAACPAPSRWLDTGCGPSRLAQLARSRCAAEFLLADPSPAMLVLARARHADLPADRFLDTPSEDLPDVAPVQVITAVQCHHYGDRAARERAVRRCFALLAPGGVFVTFENVRAETDAGHALQRERWLRWLRDQGRDEASARAHLAREDTKFFPIRVSEHVALLGRAGFASVELVWRSYGQAGFCCVKPAP